MTSPQLYTVITLVIAVSGATYTAIFALRNLLRDSVTRNDKYGNDYITVIRDSRNEPLCELGNAKYRALQCWLCGTCQPV
jgi:hypothetical protein